MSAYSEIRDLAIMECDTTALRNTLAVWLEDTNGKKPKLRDSMPLFDAMWQALPRLLDMADDNAALRAQVAELKGMFQRASDAGLRACDERDEANHRATRAEAERGEARAKCCRWRPISEAPRDGTHILAWNGNRTGHHFDSHPPTVVHWFEDGFYPSVSEIGNQPAYQATVWADLDERPAIDAALAECGEVA